MRPAGTQVSPAQREATLVNCSSDANVVHLQIRTGSHLPPIHRRGMSLGRAETSRTRVSPTMHVIGLNSVLAE